MGLFRI